MTGDRLCLGRTRRDPARLATRLQPEADVFAQVFSDSRLLFPGSLVQIQSPRLLRHFAHGRPEAPGSAEAPIRARVATLEASSVSAWAGLEKTAPGHAFATRLQPEPRLAGGLQGDSATMLRLGRRMGRGSREASRDGRSERKSCPRSGQLSPSRPRHRPPPAPRLRTPRRDRDRAIRSRHAESTEVRTRARVRAIARHEIATRTGIYMSRTEQPIETPSLGAWLLVLANAIEHGDETTELEVRRRLVDYGLGVVLDREVYRRHAERQRDQRGRRRHA